MTTDTAPPIIWLQAESERNPNVEALDGATWCAEQINEGDICYVRKDVYMTPPLDLSPLTQVVSKLRGLEIQSEDYIWRPAKAGADALESTIAECAALRTQLAERDAAIVRMDKAVAALTGEVIDTEVASELRASCKAGMQLVTP